MGRLHARLRRTARCGDIVVFRTPSDRVKGIRESFPVTFPSPVRPPAAKVSRDACCALRASLGGVGGGVNDPHRVSHRVKTLVPIGLTPNAPSVVWMCGPARFSQLAEGVPVRFRDDEGCRQYLAVCRWPEGFRSGQCGPAGAFELPQRWLWQCKACGRQISVTAGTVLHLTPNGK
jgi:hypothetical protein